MGSDSAATNGWGELTTLTESKVFTRGSVIYGVAGSVRVMNLIMYRFQPPPPQTDDLHEYMATDFVDAMRECFKTYGVAEEENNVESVQAEILIGVRGTLYSVHGGDYQVIRPAAQFDAVGTGGQIALGSLYSTQKRAPHARIQLALEAAQEYMASVRGPFMIGKV